ncbi:ATP phosphoribosyltransferase [Lentisphaerota bacterium ZTH]|nr:ATP phosphoribosyltransferase [Lentisphaerota bacterium]WET06611.1 ATP phosphoribosyltransferase [Lentisphaerota bacterium ZTH]
MLQVAIPNKGSLSEGAVNLLKEAGYKCSRSSRELIVSDPVNNIDFVFLRPRDIAVYVGNGVLDMGITGRDLAIDSRADISEILPLNFGKSRFRYAVPKDSGLEPDGFSGLKIATSYPEIVRRDLEKRGVDARIIRLDGAVEISIRLGVANVIADVVESGRTLKEAGLAMVGDALMESEAVLIARDDKVARKPEVKRMLGRLRGILVARTYAMVEYDIPCDQVEEACQITPGIEAPTVAPLSNPEWVAVKAMIKRSETNHVMDELQNLGARGIIVTDMRSCRL